MLHTGMCTSHLTASQLVFFSEHQTAPRQIGYITVLLPTSCAWRLYGGLTVIDTFYMPVDSPC